MFPFIRQPLHDRMLMVPGIQHILMLLAMRATHARRAILYQLTIAPIYIGSRFLIPVLPTAQGTNLIVFRPVHEGVISGMIDHDTTTSSHIFQETTVCLFRPSIPIIIQQKSTEKRPEFSNICLSTTWLTCQLWLFCPVINNVLIGLRADMPHTTSKAAKRKTIFLQNICLMV